MAGTDNTASEGQLTADTKTIRDWSEERDLVPVRETDADHEPTLDLRPESDVSDAERLSWDAFEEEFESSDAVAIYHEGGRVEVLEREEALQRATVEREEIEESLVAGETVTSQIRETAVIERTVVEEATIESRIADRELVEREYVDAERVERTVEGCEVTADSGGDHAEFDADWLESGTKISEDVDVAVTVDEVWSVGIEELERVTVESQVVDTAATETDTLETDEIQSSIEIEGVERTILESDVLHAEGDAGDIVQTESVHTELGEGDTFTTQLLQRRTVDEEFDVRKRLRGRIDEGEIVSADSVSRSVVEGKLVEDRDVTAVTPVEGMTTPAGEPAAADTERINPKQTDEGKTVVDASGEEVGLAVKVENDTVYVDPHPSMTDKIKAALDWGGKDEDAYPVDASKIARITGSEIELAVDEQ